MAIAVLSWLVAIPLLGFATGLRTMTPIALGCWFVYLGHLPVPTGWAFWTTSRVTVIVFTLLAIGEYVGDKLPQTPNGLGPLAWWLVWRLAGLVGALAAQGLKGSLVEGILLGSICAVLGTFVGFYVRREIVSRTAWPDWTIGLAEDGWPSSSPCQRLGL